MAKAFAEAAVSPRRPCDAGPPAVRALERPDVRADQAESAMAPERGRLVLAACHDDAMRAARFATFVREARPIGQEYERAQ